MHELDGRRRADVAVARVAAHLRRSQSQHRPQALPPGCNEMVRQLRNQIDIGHGLIENDPVDGFHILVDQLNQRLEALRRGAAFIEWDDNTHGHDLSNDPVCYTGVLPPYSVAR